MRAFIEKELKEYFACNNNIVIAIDGPAGSGKSTIASVIAEKFGLNHYSMGNTFRTLACAIEERKIDVLDYSSVKEFIVNSDLEYDGKHIYVNGKYYRNHELDKMSKEASIIAANSNLHSMVSSKVRTIVEERNIVVDGRAMGTKVFYDAKVKIFLDASLHVRATRRHTENEDKVFEEIKKELIERDKRDRSRKYAPLVCNDQYYVIDTSDYSVDCLFQNIKKYIHFKLIISEIYSKRQILDLIEDVLVMGDEKNTYFDVNYFIKLVDLLLHKFDYSRTEHFNQKIRLEMLNVIGNRLRDGENGIWSKVLEIFPDIKAEAKQYGLSLFEPRLSVNEKVDFYSNEILKLKNVVKLCNEKRFNSDGDIVMLIKPTFSMYDNTVKEIVSRIVNHNCNISKIRVMKGSYFRKHQDKIFSFYEEAYMGYKSGENDENLLKFIREKYDHSFFEFIFGEEYSDSMVVTAGELIERYKVSPSVISELWQFGREDVTVDKIVEYLNLSGLEYKEDNVIFVKNDKSYKLKKNIIVDGKVRWFHNDLCFGINKVCRSRSTFCVQDKRIRDGKTTIIVNGHFQGLLEMFTKDEDELIIALNISCGENSSSIHMLKKCLAGDNSNPARCLPGSIRRDGYEGILSSEWDNKDRMILNGLNNIVHMSSGLLEGMKETAIMFDEDKMNHKLVKQLMKVGHSETEITYLLSNPLSKGNGQRIFEMTAYLDEEELLQQVNDFMKTCS